MTAQEQTLHLTNLELFIKTQKERIEKLKSKCNCKENDKK
jgi:hypothetical protein